jgi:hypothetical protein
MDRGTNPVDSNSLSQTYGTLVDLWTSGTQDYHSLLSDYLTANSIFVAAIGFILAPPHVSLYVPGHDPLRIWNSHGPANGDRARTVFCSNSPMGMAPSK